MATCYVVGIAFAEDLRTVLLIRKNRPKWMSGLLNGVGGKVEPGEEYLTAMVREFREETGLDVPKAKWRRVLVYTGVDYQIEFFTATTDAIFDAATMTDEPLERWDLTSLTEAPVVKNLRWIIPLCLDRHIQLPVVVSEPGGYSYRW